MKEELKRLRKEEAEREKLEKREWERQKYRQAGRYDMMMLTNPDQFAQLMQQEKGKEKRAGKKRVDGVSMMSSMDDSEYVDSSERNEDASSGSVDRTLASPSSFCSDIPSLSLLRSLIRIELLCIFYLPLDLSSAGGDGKRH